MIYGASATDLFMMSEYRTAGSSLNNQGNYNLSGKTSVTLNPAANNGILVTFGDSLGCNVATTAYTPVNANTLQFCIYNGATYSALDPALGCSNSDSPLGPGNMFTRVANAVQGTGKFTNTILVAAGIGGSTHAMWAIDQFLRIKATFARLASRGVTATAVCIQLGANDAGLSQVACAASLTSIIALIRLYYAGPIFIATETWNGGVTNANVVAAQAAAVNHGSLIWAGPNTDSLNATNRQADNTHWNDTGAAACAALWLTALQAYGPPFT